MRWRWCSGAAVSLAVYIIPCLYSVFCGQGSSTLTLLFFLFSFCPHHRSRPPASSLASVSSPLLFLLCRPFATVCLICCSGSSLTRSPYTVAAAPCLPGVVQLVPALRESVCSVCSRRSGYTRKPERTPEPTSPPPRSIVSVSFIHSLLLPSLSFSFSHPLSPIENQLSSLAASIAFIDYCQPECLPAACCVLV